jgi:DNA polymerase-1
MGQIAAKALLPDRQFDLIRGAPQQVQLRPAYETSSTAPARKVLVTWNAIYGIHQPKWKRVIQSDLHKALRHFADKLDWVDPELVIAPSPANFAAWARERRRAAAAQVSAGKGKLWISSDVETNIAHMLKLKLYTVQIGDDKEVIILPYSSKEGKVYYTEEEKLAITASLQEVYTDPNIIIIGQNFGYFDRMVIERILGCTPSPVLDTILIHHLGESEYPHSLAFIGSLYLDIPAWKADHAGTSAASDEELFVYGGTDVAATHRIVRPLVRQMQARNQAGLYEIDAKMQSYCVGMKRLGMRVDERARLRHTREQTKKSKDWLAKVHALQPGLNPRSTQQMSALLFDRWGLPIQEVTDSGEPSTNAASLRALFSSPLVDEDQREIIRAVRMYRKSEKLLSTYLHKWHPGSDLVVDGYIHFDYSAHTVVTGRLAGPSQQIPFAIRDIFIPPPGCVYVDADMDQLELRFAAALAKAELYLDAFGLSRDHPDAVDPHSMTGALMFGSLFWKVEGAPEKRIDKGSGKFKRLRDLAKTICFASLYGAESPKVYEIVMKDEAEEDDLENGVHAGDLIFADYTLDQVRALHREWKARAPEFTRWWKKIVHEYRRQGYIEEPINGRRRYFKSEEYNEILNFKVQAGGFALVANSMVKLIEKHLPFDYKSRTGLCNQLHDAVLFGVPESEADYTVAVVSETMTQQALGLNFTAKAKAGCNWKEV